MAQAFLTIEQAAGRLQITPYTLRLWIKKGKLRAIKPGRAWRIPECALDELTSVNDSNHMVAMSAVEAVRARDARLSSQRKPRGTDITEVINQLRDERSVDLSS